MNNQKREMFLMIADGNMCTLPILYHFDKLSRCNDVLNYLLRNRITGDKFITLFKECNNSILTMASEILKRINKDLQRKEIIGGKDYKV